MYQKTFVGDFFCNVISTSNRLQMSNFSSSQKSTFSELYSGSNIIITKSDKSGQTVPLSESDYITSVDTMLNSGLYAILNKDPFTDDHKEAQRNVKNSVLLNDQAIRVVKPSINN